MLQRQLQLARDSLPELVREQTQKDMDAVADRFTAVINHKHKVFQESLGHVRDASAVAVADEVSRVTGDWERAAALRELEAQEELSHLQSVASKAHASLVSDRDMQVGVGIL